MCITDFVILTACKVFLFLVGACLELSAQHAKTHNFSTREKITKKLVVVVLSYNINK